MKKAQILIVEDEGIVALDLQTSLEGLGYDVPVIATSGQEALEETARTCPDLILMDIMLGEGMDGIRAAEQIRNRFRIPIIFLTAYADENTFRRAKITEPYGYLLKPFEEREVHMAIEIALYKHQAEEEREKLIEELDAFAHTVAHDLKIPMSYIVGFAEIVLMQHGATLDEQTVEHLQTIARSAEKVANIVNELLLLAEVRRVGQVKTEVLDMANIVAEAKQRLSHADEEYPAEIVLPVAWPEAMGYGPWVEEVWVNYLSNAIKYGGRPPRVELGATVQVDGMVCFWVRDNGPGLTAEEQAQLFTPFTRLHQVSTKGHGLGLSIVQRIVDRLGGQVGVESDGVPGQGSVFSFTLPAPARL